MSGWAPIAVLPMYDFPWTAEANDALWVAMAARLDEAGIEAPKTLTRGGDLDALWRNPRLVFGQTCGYPYATRLKDAVVLIAAPTYAFPGCEEASHRSFIIRRASDPRRALAEFRGATAGLAGRALLRPSAAHASARFGSASVASSASRAAAIVEALTPAAAMKGRLGERGLSATTATRSMSSGRPRARSA